MVTSHTYQSDLRDLPAMRYFFKQAWHQVLEAQGDDVDRSRQFQDFVLALQEAASNVIRHAYKGQSGRPIHLVVESDGHSLAATLHHEGQGFDRDQVAPPRFDGSAFGGFGCWLIDELVDRCEYDTPTPGHHTVRLVMHLNHIPAEAGSPS